jgi:hypothetical protein
MSAGVATPVPTPGGRFVIRRFASQPAQAVDQHAERRAEARRSPNRAASPVCVRANWQLRVKPCRKHLVRASAMTGQRRSERRARYRIRAGIGDGGTLARSI